MKKVLFLIVEPVMSTAIVFIKPTNEITATPAPIWRLKYASLFLLQFFFVHLAFSSSHYFVSLLRRATGMSWAAYACLCCRLSLAIEKWIFLNFLNTLFYEVYFQRYFFYSFCLQFSLFCVCVCVYVWVRFFIFEIYPHFSWHVW